MEELKLIRGLKKKDEEALSSLIQNYSRLIYGIVRKTLRFNFNNGEINEVFYEIILKIWDNIEHYDIEKGTLINFIVSISKYTSIDYLRKINKVNKAKLQEEVLMNLGYYDNYSLTDEIEDFTRLLSSLKDEDKEIFIRRYYFDEDIKTISKALGKNDLYLYNRLSRGRKKLEKNLGGVKYE